MPLNRILILLNEPPCNPPPPTPFLLLCHPSHPTSSPPASNQAMLGAVSCHHLQCTLHNGKKFIRSPPPQLSSDKANFLNSLPLISSLELSKKVPHLHCLASFLMNPTTLCPDDAVTLNWIIDSIAPTLSRESLMPLFFKWNTSQYCTGPGLQMLDNATISCSFGENMFMGIKYWSTLRVWQSINWEVINYQPNQQVFW